MNTKESSTGTHISSGVCVCDECIHRTRFETEHLRSVVFNIAGYDRIIIMQELSPLRMPEFQVNINCQNVVPRVARQKGAGGK